MSLADKRNQRLELIKQIEAKLASKLLVYFTADSPLVGALISEDAVLPMYAHLRAMGKCKRISLYLYSLGGQLETPWKMITMLREFCDELHVIVPYKAYSAATMIAIGTDKIHMTSKAELGPIDPAMQVMPVPGAMPKLPDLGVEDIAAYLKFVRERAALTDQAAVSAAVQALSTELTPMLLGRMERIYSHIRLVARNLLTQHKPTLDDKIISSVTEALTEKMYVHGHGIGRKEAQGIGLDIDFLDSDTESAVWSLYEEYEEEFRLRESKDAESYFAANSDIYERPNTAVACIESEVRLHEFTCKIWAQRLRSIPANPAINVNLGFNFPPNINPQQLPQQMQLVIQQILQQAAQQLPGLVAQELQRQSPVTGLAARAIGGYWRKVV